MGCSRRQGATGAAHAAGPGAYRWGSSRGWQRELAPPVTGAPSASLAACFPRCLELLRWPARGSHEERRPARGRAPVLEPAQGLTGERRQEQLLHEEGEEDVDGEVRGRQRVDEWIGHPKIERPIPSITKVFNAWLKFSTPVWIS